MSSQDKITVRPDWSGIQTILAVGDVVEFDEEDQISGMVILSLLKQLVELKNTKCCEACGTSIDIVDGVGAGVLAARTSRAVQKVLVEHRIIGLGCRCGKRLTAEEWEDDPDWGEEHVTEKIASTVIEALIDVAVKAKVV